MSKCFYIIIYKFFIRDLYRFQTSLSLCHVITLIANRRQYYYLVEFHSISFTVICIVGRKAAAL